MDISSIRKDYKLKSLLENDIAKNAFDQFTIWWNEALKSELDEVNAMTLATATKDGVPNARIVLLKGYDENGFVFFTNYNSNKGKDLGENPFAALLIFWAPLERQIRINGTVKKVAAEQSDAYFKSRPIASQIGAWASPQSSVIENRNIIEANEKAYTEKLGGENIERPPHWGGYIVKPTSIEFWQGRPNRLHDRILYTLQENNSWNIQRLAP